MWNKVHRYLHVLVVGDDRRDQTNEATRNDVSAGETLETLVPLRALECTSKGVVGEQIECHLIVALIGRDSHPLRIAQTTD